MQIGLNTGWTLDADVLGGKQLGAATTYEYPITDWAGNPGVGQNFGSCRVEWYSSGNHAYGPYGQIW